MLYKNGKLACMLALPAFLISQAITLSFDFSPLVQYFNCKLITWN